MAKAEKKTAEVHLTIAPPNMKTAKFLIEGTTPLVMNRFSQKMMDGIIETQKEGSTAKKGKKRKPKNFKALYEGAKHIAQQGWCGIPASAFRCAMISACKMVGFAMTRAKLSVFIEADGYDREEGTPLVKITKGNPKYVEHVVRIAGNTCDIRPRPMWMPGWQAIVRVRYDTDQFKLEDIANLMVRVGTQNGILEGRPDSKTSCGMGWGLFKLCGNKS